MNHIQLAKLYDLANDRKGAWGAIHGFEAGIVTEQRFDSVVAVVRFLFKSPLTGEQSAAVREALSPFRIVPGSAQDGAVVVFPLAFVFVTKKVREQIDAIFRAVTDAFRASGCLQYEGCGLCEGDGFDRVRLVKGIAMKTHDACHEKLMGEVREAYRKIDASTENLAKGYGWAIGGAVIGGVVNFLVNYFLGYQVVLLYALVPGAAMFMYKAAKAPLRKEIPFVLAALSVVVSVVTILLLYTLYAQSWGLTLSVFLAEGIPDVPDILSLFVEEMTVAVLFSLLGVLIVWRYLFTPRR